MKKTTLFKFILSLLFLVLLLFMDFLVGLNTEQKFTISSSKQFINEANYITLSTKTILPSIDHQYMTFDNHDRKYRTNETGEIIGSTVSLPRNATKILFLGGSTTECNEVDEVYRFPFLVGKQLTNNIGQNFIGANIGVRGNTVHDSLNLFINHPSVHDASYIVLMHNINDRLLLSHLGSYESIKFSNSPITLKSIKNRIQDLYKNSLDYLTYNSNIIFLIRTKLFSYNPWTGEQIPTDFLKEDQLDFEFSNFKTISVEFETKLNIFVSAVKASGKTPILMTQLLGKKSKEQNEFNNIIRRIANQNHVTLVDLAKDLDSKKEIMFLSDQIHLNNIGSQIVGEHIAKALADKLFKKKFKNGKYVETTSEIISLINKKLSTCKTADQNNFEFKISNKKLLFPMSGRYPYLSDNMKFFSYQNWNEGKENIVLLDLENKTIKKLSHSSSIRHAIIHEYQNQYYLVYSKKDLNKKFEKIHIYDIAQEKEKSIFNNFQFETSIPYAFKDKIYFAATKINNKESRYLSLPDIFEYSLVTNVKKQITNSHWEEWRPTLDKVHNTLYFIENHSNNFDISRINLVTHQKEQFLITENDEWDPNVSSDGSMLTFASKMNNTWDIYMTSTKENKKLIPITNDESDNWDPVFTPNSNSIIYASSSKNMEPHIYYQCLYGEKNE